MGCGEDCEYGNDRRCRGMKSVFGEGQCRVKYETEIFDRQAEYYGFGGREGKRGVYYFRGLLRETDKKEFSVRYINESKIIKRHPR